MTRAWRRLTTSVIVAATTYGTTANAADTTKADRELIGNMAVQMIGFIDGTMESIKECNQIAQLEAKAACFALLELNLGIPAAKFKGVLSDIKTYVEKK